MILKILSATFLFLLSSTSLVDIYHLNISNPDRNITLILQVDKLVNIDASKISIASVKLGMNPQEVKKRFRKSTQQKTSTRKNVDSLCIQDKYQTIIKYDRLEFLILGDTLNSGSVYSIKTSNPAYSTSEGIRVGDSISKLKRRYAKYNYSQTENSIVYGNNHGLRAEDSQPNTYSLSFITNKDRITRIELDQDICY